jgi:hypothetical protein
MLDLNQRLLPCEGKRPCFPAPAGFCRYRNNSIQYIDQERYQSSRVCGCLPADSRSDVSPDESH